MMKLICGRNVIEYKSFGQWVENDAMGNLEMYLDCEMTPLICNSEEQIEQFKKDCEKNGEAVLAKYGAKRRWFGLRGGWAKSLRLGKSRFEIIDIVERWTPKQAASNLNAADFKKYLVETGLSELMPVELVEKFRH